MTMHEKYMECRMNGNWRERLFIAYLYYMWCTETGKNRSDPSVAEEFSAMEYVCDREGGSS